MEELLPLLLSDEADADVGVEEGTDDKGCTAVLAAGAAVLAAAAGPAAAGAVAGGAAAATAGCTDEAVAGAAEVAEEGAVDVDAEEVEAEDEGADADAAAAAVAPEACADGVPVSRVVSRSPTGRMDRSLLRAASRLLPLPLGDEAADSSVALTRYTSPAYAEPDSSVA